MPERTQKPIDPVPWGPKQGDGDGPRSPDVSRPDTKDLLKKMPGMDVQPDCGWGDDGKSLYITARTGLYRIKLAVAGEKLVY